jgi:uncharacterized membrane protein
MSSWIAKALRHEWLSLSIPGVIGAAVFGASSFTPSLLPRTWVLQGIVAGLSAGFGYALGVFLAWFIRGFVYRTTPPQVLAHARRVVAVTASAVLAIAVWLGWQWQIDIHRIMGWPQPSRFDGIWLTALALVVLRGLVGMGRGVRFLYRLFDTRLRRRLPRRAAAPLAAMLVIIVLVGVNDGLVWRGIVRGVDAAAGSLNNSTPADVVRPAWPQSSGSPASLIPWESLGMQGREFVASSLSPSQLSRFSQRPARRPVRIYAGIKSADGAEARAALAVRDLRRAGGFSRAVLVVATTTGTGWVDPGAARSIEYMYNGDTAIVAIQYSYLPSTMSFLVDKDRALEAGATLFNRVYDVWAALPPDQRPKLLVTGTSLGAFGAEMAFSGLPDMQNRTDGVLFAGPPVASRLHSEFVTHRDPGSLQWRPVYQDGRVVRFGQQASDWMPNGDVWKRPRVLYLQNGSDPIVVWSPELAFTRPDWMAEPLPPDVLPQMRWIPVVTFWQVTADLLFSLEVGSGRGHSYRDSFAAGWAAVAPPPGWTTADTERLAKYDA